MMFPLSSVCVFLLILDNFFLGPYMSEFKQENTGTLDNLNREVRYRELAVEVMDMRRQRGI